jgi:hypothetical protein
MKGKASYRALVSRRALTVVAELQDSASPLISRAGMKAIAYVQQVWGKAVALSPIRTPRFSISDVNGNSSQRFLTAINEINHLVQTVDQEVGGSSPPSCTNAKSIR